MHTIHTRDAPSHTGPVPQVVEAGGWIDVSAMFGTDPTTHQIPVGARDEAEQLFANPTAIDFGRPGENARFMIEVTAHRG